MGTGFFENGSAPPDPITASEGGAGFYDGGPAYTEIDPTQITNFVQEAANSAAASEASHQGSNASAATATTQAGIATTQAGVATNEAGVATTQAGNATSQANNAALSEANAYLSAQSAAAHDTSAGTHDTNATTSATAAASSATNSQNSATAAANSASAAATSATNAAASATAASNSATAAANSASTAEANVTSALNNAALTGTPTAPTASPGTNTAQVANTAFVQNVISPLVGAVVYKGTWNASTNSPALASGTGTKGWLYKVSVAGTTSIDGNSQWNVGDSIVFDGTTWDKIDGVSTEVTSVAGRVGAVTLAVSDVSGAAPSASPAFTGTPTAPTASQGNNSTQVASTAYVDTGLATKAPTASPAFSGTPTSPTPTAGDNSTKVATTAFVLANAAAGGATGQCKLSYVTVNQVALKPFNGNSLKINGAVVSVPSGGLTYTISGLSASTLYYVYAWMNSGTMTLELSTTTHATSATAGNVGTEIKSGDDTRSLVGMVYTNASTQFVDAAQTRQVRSWFNDNGVTGAGSAGSVTNTTATSPTELDTTIRVLALLWAGENYHGNALAQAFSNTAGQIAYAFLGVNGTASGSTGLCMSATANNQAQAISMLCSAAAADGLVTFSMLMQSSGASYTANYAARTVTIMTGRR